MKHLLLLCAALGALAGLPLPSHLQGVSLRPLLADPQAPWDRPAISTMHDDNHAVRTERWRSGSWRV